MIMIKQALQKLNDKQLNILGTYSALIARAKRNGLKEEYERNCGKLRGFLECLCQMEVITGAECKSLYLWFFEEDRNGYGCPSEEKAEESKNGEKCQYELIQTHMGYEIRKPSGKFYLYVSKEHDGEYIWVNDHTYAKKFKLETALKHIEILKGKG